MTFIQRSFIDKNVSIKDIFINCSFLKLDNFNIQSIT